MSLTRNSVATMDGASSWEQILSRSQHSQEETLPKPVQRQVVNDENSIKEEAYRMYCFSPVRSIPHQKSSKELKKQCSQIQSPKFPKLDQAKAPARRITQSPAILMPTPGTYRPSIKDQNLSRDPLTELHGLADFKRTRDESNFLFSPRNDFLSNNMLSPRICIYPSSQTSCGGRYVASNSAGGGIGRPYHIGAQMLGRSSVPLSPAAQHTAMKLLANHSSAWNERFNELLDYKKNHGDCLVPQRYPQNPQLGVWVNKQRAEYKLFKEGKKSSMTKERIQALESVGFIWAKRRKGQPTWDLKFDELTEYCQEHGDCLVPTKYAENPALGRWVSTQRAQYKLMQENKPTTMTEERVKMLESLGFVWRLQF
jgi:hypothetical protein